MSDKSLTFTSSDSGLGSFKFVLESAENNGKTIFAPSERARLKLYPGGKKPSISTTIGSASVYISNVPQTFTEFIAFRDSETANLTYYVDSLVSAVWEGSGSGKPKIYGSKLVLPTATTGVLKVTYKTSYDLIDITCTRPTYLLVTAKTSELSGDYLLDYTDGYETDVSDKDVVMTIRDACTKETLSGASIYINDKFTGQTDSEGIIRLGSLKSGTYSLLITKSGYQDSDKDTIKNDFFVVQ